MASLIPRLSPCANEKLEELGKVHDVRSVTGRENLNTCGQMNELPHTYWQNILVQLWKLHGQQNGTRWHYATLPGSMASYGKCIQTCTFKKKKKNTLTCSLTWQTDGCTPWRMASKVNIICQAAFSSSLLCCILLQKSCQNGLVPKHDYVYYRLCNYVCGSQWWSAYAQLSPLYLLSTLNITDVINYFKPSHTSMYCKRQKVGW